MPFLLESTSTKTIKFDDETIHAVVYWLQGINLKSAAPGTLSSRSKCSVRRMSNKAKGNIFTPQRIIESAVKLMEIDYHDKVIDPACGTGGFLFKLITLC